MIPRSFAGGAARPEGLRQVAREALPPVPDDEPPEGMTDGLPSIKASPKPPGPSSMMAVRGSSAPPARGLPATLAAASRVPSSLSMGQEMMQDGASGSALADMPRTRGPGLQRLPWAFVPPVRGPTDTGARVRSRSPQGGQDPFGGAPGGPFGGKGAGKANRGGHPDAGLQDDEDPFGEAPPSMLRSSPQPGTARRSPLGPVDYEPPARSGLARQRMADGRFGRAPSPELFEGHQEDAGGGGITGDEGGSVSPSGETSHVGRGYLAIPPEAVEDPDDDRPPEAPRGSPGLLTKKRLKASI